MAGKPPTDRAGLVPSHAKETASGLSSFRQRAPKAEDAAETAAKRAWSGNLNATHLLPCREDNKTQGYIDDWCNGSTQGFEPWGGGSKPSLSANMSDIASEG